MFPAQLPGVGQAVPDVRRSESFPQCQGSDRLESLTYGAVRRSLTYRRGITLVEMLIAVAITLVMMAAVVTVFANLSDSVQKRRAVVEMSNSLRHTRNMLQRDLAGATCPTIPWQRPESNHGYFEIIEGPACDFSPSELLTLNTSTNEPIGIDVRTSQVPGSNLVPIGWVTDGRALGDFDDILMLTVRNEKEPFVGRIPSNVVNANGGAFGFRDWGNATLRSPLAEVVWFSVENPPEALNPNGYFGEPGFRTVYRRTLLIAPSLDPYRAVDNNGNVVQSFPGVVRILPRTPRDRLDLALAALVAFQERYDLSVRLEWDPLLQYGGASTVGRWKIVANTLADLTKRENRYEHHGYLLSGTSPTRAYPYSAASVGAGYGNGTKSLVLVPDQDLRTPGTGGAAGQAIAVNGLIQQVARANGGAGYLVRPFVYVDDSNATAPATVRALVHTAGVEDDERTVVYVTAGMVPLGGDRRGEDVMLTDALAFDVRVYDPGAPILGLADTTVSDVVVEPGDAGWSEFLASGNSIPYGYGAYVDLGYLGRHSEWRQMPLANALNNLQTAVQRQFAGAPSISSKLNLWGVAPRYFEPYRVYDTWSFHYENNGLDEDGDNLVDEGTNGFDDPGEYLVDATTNPPTTVIDTRLGVDDAGERETAPPYDVPLRGVQVRLRAYERDSRQVREVGVKQHFVPE